MTTSKFKISNRVWSVLLCLALLLSCVPLSPLTTVAAAATAEKNITLGASHIEGAQASNIYFGTYKQSSDGKGGYNVDPIKWRVLSNADGKLFLLSDKNLDVFEYHKEYEPVTWKTSTMRSWLNGLANNRGNGENAINYKNDNFLSTAFSASEQVAIADTTVVNNDNPSYGTDGGNDTTDKVFLLSIEEAQNTAYGFTDDNTSITDTRKATNTAYVAGGGKIGTSGVYGIGNADYWWLRSPGNSSDDAACVTEFGIVYVLGVTVNYAHTAVRPAFNLDLNSVLFTSAAYGGKSSTTAVGGDGEIFENVDINTLTDNDGYKLTLLDSNRNAFEATLSSISDNVVTVSYSGAKTGDNEYISAVIKNGSTVKHYGRLGLASESGTQAVTLPDDFNVANGDVLCIFNEQYNGDYMTDYASELIEIGCEITFDAGGGIGTMNAVKVGINNEYPLPSNEFTAPVGKQFKAWSIDGKEYAVGDKITVSANTTVTATWEKIPAEAPNAQVSANLTLIYGDYTNQKLTVSVERKDGYTYSYQWVNSDNVVVETTDTLNIPDNLNAGTYDYACVVFATRNDNDEYNSIIIRNIWVKVNVKAIDNDSAIVTLSETELTYNGQDQKPAVTVTYNGNHLNENTDYTISWPADCKNVGSKTITVNFKGNYSGSVQKTFVIKKAPLAVAANNKTITYGDAPANNGVTYSGFVSNETETVLSGTMDFDYTYAKGNNVGTYEITPKGLTSDNYEITFKKGVLTVEKADATCTAPTANDLTYTGVMQELVTAGTVDGGKMVFSLDKEGGYSETLSAKNAGKYTVWYKVIGDDNHNGTAPASITVEIKKATPDLGTVSADGTVDDTTKPEDVVLTQTGTVKGTFVITDTAILANKQIYNYTFTPHDTDNWNRVNGHVIIDVLDTVLPTISISLDDHKWTFWDTITFGLFYNESKEVTISYADNENGSGLKDMLYSVANKEMTVEELQNVQWTAYTDAFDIDPDGKYVVYAKAVDNDGNTLIINSNGLVLDKTQAAVEGITNGGTYYGQLVFTVADELAGVKSVVIDGNDETHFEGQYVIGGDNAEHTVVITDNAGNVTEYKVTVYKNYTVTFVADGETVTEITVGHGENAAFPKVPPKDGYVGKWDRNNENITSDTVINAVYTEIPAIKPDEVKPEDKADLEDTKKQLEDMLNDDDYTKDDKKDIQEAIDAIDDALAELNKPVTDPDSPQTGDNSHVALWFALLFISGGTVITLTVVDRQRKSAEKR